MLQRRYRVNTLANHEFFALSWKMVIQMVTWDKVLKTGANKICGRQPFKKNRRGLIFHKFYLAHSSALLSHLICQIRRTQILKKDVRNV